MPKEVSSETLSMPVPKATPLMQTLLARNDELLKGYKPKMFSSSIEQKDVVNSSQTSQTPSNTPGHTNASRLGQ